MTWRFGFRNFRDYFTMYRLKTREKRIKLMNYLRLERQKIIERERQKLFRRMIFWSVFLSSTYFIYSEIYAKKMEINKMNQKLDNIYSPILERQLLKDQLKCIMLKPKTLDQLTNIVCLAYRYHFKIIVRMGDLPKREKIIMSEQFDGKCLFLNLSTLNQQSINEVNSTLYVQTGASCSEVNSLLISKGYQPLFPEQFVTEKIYDAITNNLPLNKGQLSKNTISLEMISASGQNFRSAGQTNRYGQIPSLNSLFIGTGGIFALPSAITLKIHKRQPKQLKQQNYKININDVNLKIDAIRKLTEINDQFIEVELSNSSNSTTDRSSMFLNCKEKHRTFKDTMNQCSSLAQRKGIPLLKVQKMEESKQLYNIFFSVNNSIFEQFLLKFGRDVDYSYKNGLLKVKVDDLENQQKIISIISEITGNNGVLVWCSSHELLNRIKPSLDSSEVGAELMRKIVQVRQGLDRRNIFYSHNRYQDYFAKGLFRRLTQFFW